MKMKYLRNSNPVLEKEKKKNYSTETTLLKDLND